MKFTALALILAALAATYLAVHVVVLLFGISTSYVPVLWIIVLGVLALVNALLLWRAS